MNESEAQTRALYIDKQLALAGWNVKDRSHVIEELEIHLNPSKVRERPPVSEFEDKRFSDYGLLLNGEPAAVLEAKRTSRRVEVGQEQALQYAQQLRDHHAVELPFVFYSNGHKHFFWDSDSYPPEEIFGFPSKDDLEWMCKRRRERRPLSIELINRGIAGRDYQIQGIRTLLEAIEAKRRKFLMVMATGTGKTRTAIALMDVLQRAHWAKRVLFLVDRIALQEQALDAFKEHIPAEPRWPEKGDRDFPTNRRIYVTTYPTMLNLIQNGTTPQTYISPFFFDVVIADESHRSIYNVYENVLKYFSAIKIGLTATPTDFVEHDTYDLFDCKLRDPSFAYSFDEAIAHIPPFLCDYEVLKVRSKFQLEGIHGKTLKRQEQRKLIALGKDLEEIDFEGTELERKVTNSGTNGLIVREFMEESIKDPSGTLPGKTIIFAISIDHAHRLQKLFDEFYPEHKGRLARVLVSEDSRVHGKGGLLDQFKNKDMPRVAISVDMLDTGVDVLEVVNLVFAKPVYSYVKFWQMIGRGTRVLLEGETQRKDWCPDKDRFLIIDCWGNFEWHNMHPTGREPQVAVSAPVRLFRARIDQLEAALTAGDAALAERVKADLRSDLATLPERNIIVQQASADLHRLQDDSFWSRMDGDDLGFLRTTIAPVLRARASTDLKSLRFQIDVVEYSTARLADETDRSEAIRESIRSQLDELPMTVNLVNRERALIEAALKEVWWIDGSDADLHQLAERLAPLMKYRTIGPRPWMELDLNDMTVIKEKIDLGGNLGLLSTASYRERIESFIRDLVEANPVLEKLQRGQSISMDEIHELAELLESSELQVTEKRLQQIYDNRTAHFLQLIRHVLGLEHVSSWEETVSKRFDAFIAAHTDLTSLQIQFLRTLNTFILQRQQVEKRDLVDAPFTLLHPSGIQGLFTNAEIDEILRLAGELVGNA
ncbi:DEAD/DEAH box helicase family protein [Candidatus Bipolaricaulota bacterium]|nr:DEAD/DEAH box helicase family protein [Candidatus Bipolaricaulota bacterium]